MTIAENVIEVTWAEMKTFITDRGSNIQVFVRDNIYVLRAYDGLIFIAHDMDRNPTDTTDLLDFENNYLSGANEKFYNLSYTASNRLRVDNTTGGPAETTMPVISQSLRHDDMNVSNGGIARNTLVGTTFTTVYDYDGSGSFFNFQVTLEDEDDWEIRLEVDGNQIFSILTVDLDNENVYGYKYTDLSNRDGKQVNSFSLARRTVFYQVPSGASILYESNVTVQVRKSTGADKKFRAGLIALTK